VSGLVRPAHRLALALALGAGACEARVEGVPEGAVARAGEVVLWPEDVEGTLHQLGAYAQARFRGPEGRRELLDALVDTELLAQEAIDAGLGDDPRVEWAVVEELAALQLSTELERRLPRAHVAADEAGLAVWWRAHAAELMRPEQRSLEGVLFGELAPAEAALEACRLGTSKLSDYGTVVFTPLAERDDAEYPAFHDLLFDPALHEGDWLAHPVLSERRIVVGKVHRIVPAQVPPLDDPDTRERVVNAVWEERAAPIRAALLAELADRWPEQPP
jgi:hypothetical protein